ncbi:MAG TPA: TolC family protein [Polyangia bacterium]|nr:TolC family protein [Polyangia bacterium]
MRSALVALVIVASLSASDARAAQANGLPRAVDVPSPTGAPEPDGLSLRDAITRAATGNIQLLKQNVALRTSEGNVVTQLGTFDFVLAGDGTYSRNVNPSLGQGDQSAGSTHGAVFDLSLTRALESGGNLTLALQGRGSTSTQLFTCGVTPPATTTTSTTMAAMMAAAQASCYVYVPSATLTFTQPVLRGFGREIAEANLRKARISADLTLLNRQAQAANTVRDTIIAYWELAYQTQDLDIQRFSEQLAREQLRTTEAQVQVGKMGDLAAAAVRRAIATAEQAEATSEQARMGRALDLQRLFGAAVPGAFVGYKAADALAATRHDVDVDVETKHALAASPALRSIKLGLQLTQSDVRVARDSMRPLVNIVALASEGGRNHDLGTSIHQLFEWDDREYSIGFNFTLPVQNRAARGTEEVARATEDSAELDARDLELSIRDTVARMAAQIRSAGARLDYGREAVKFSEDNLKAEMARFQVGTSTNNDVLLRQQELKQAQESLARATADLLEGDVALAALTGDILETYGVTLR